MKCDKSDIKLACEQTYGDVAKGVEPVLPKVELYKVILLDSELFIGTYEECKNYVVTSYTPAYVDSMGDYFYIASPSGRMASYVLEWK